MLPSKSSAEFLSFPHDVAAPASSSPTLGLGRAIIRQEVPRCHQTADQRLLEPQEKGVGQLPYDRFLRQVRTQSLGQAREEQACRSRGLGSNARIQAELGTPSH